MAKTPPKAFVDQMKQALLEERAKLEHELAQMGTADPKNPSAFTPTVPDMGTGEDENAAESATYSDNLAVAEELKGALKDVISALVRVEKGIYGLCKYCNTLIDERRLRARPASASCIDCKKKLTREA